MRIGSLFSGYGGLDLAAEAVWPDAELAWYAEFDDAPSRVMDRHHPGLTNYGDVTVVDWASVGPVDLITGGSPCQDVSAAGRHAGMTDGTRSNLWVAMREAVSIIEPTFVVWENVRGAHSAKAYSDVESEEGLLGGDGVPALRATGRVLGDLSSLGYDAEWRTISASSVGAPHRRDRVFVLAWRRGSTVAHSLGGRDGGWHGSPGPGEGAWQADQVGGPVGSPGGARPVDKVALLPTPRASHGDKGGPSQRDSKGHYDLPAIGRLLPAVRTSDTNGVGLHGDGGLDLRTAVVTTDFGEFSPAIRRWGQVLGRPAPPPTELSPRGRHRLSEHFTEWLMGLPAGWICDTEGVTRRDAIKMAGNGVVPQQAAAALTDMLQHVPHQMKEAA